MSAPTLHNRAVFQDNPGEPGTIRDNAYPSTIADDHLVIQVKAWAINPADHVIQDIPLPFISYPVILGEDIAGIVVQTGSSSTASKYEIGDKVFAFALGSSIMTNEQGGFQEYVVVNAALAAKVPQGMSFAEAAVFPLGCMTAAIGLFGKPYLGLPLPVYSKESKAGNGKSILIWGGSSSVGCNAIQLVKALGYNVVTTCAPHNTEFVKSIGADIVFDYGSPSVVSDIVAEIDKGICVGIFQAAAGTKGVGAPALVAAQSKQDLFMATTNPVMPGSVPDGVQAKFLGMEGNMEEMRREVCMPVFEFLGKMLADGRWKVAPRPEVWETKGLEGIQGAMDRLREGVSARKVVVVAE